MHISQTTFAHLYWKIFLKNGDHILDATCGNGKDSLALAQIVLKESTGKLYCLDIQKEAIENTKSHLTIHLSKKQCSHIEYLHRSHSNIQDLCPLNGVIFNLGYLPGGDYKITTTLETTITSIKQGMEALSPNGIISIMAYPGHPEGEKETLFLKKWLPTLPPSQWESWSHQKTNATNASILFIIKKRS
jgi:hypothetical protein